MPCYVIPGDDGDWFACSRGRKIPELETSCYRCGRVADYLCDHPVGEGTCDRDLCRRCAAEVGPDRHLCPEHLDQEQERVEASGVAMLARQPKEEQAWYRCESCGWMIFTAYGQELLSDDFSAEHHAVDGCCPRCSRRVLAGDVGDRHQQQGLPFGPWERR